MSYNFPNGPYNNPNPYTQQGPLDNPYAQSQLLTRQQSILSQVYLWMTFGLIITGAVAAFTSSSDALLNLVYGNPISFLVLVLAEIGLVFAISAGIQRMSSGMATALFILYSALNGLTLSVIFLVYERGSIASTFFVTGVTFAAMSLYGYTTKRDLSTVGNIAFMALIGIILASLVNLFLQSTALYWVITYAGVLIFVALTAYDTQRIKRMAAATSNDNIQRVAIIGALRLYLDFINLFLFLLRIFGRRR